MWWFGWGVMVHTWKGSLVTSSNGPICPDGLPPDELTADIAEQLFATPVEGRSLGTDPVTGHEIVAKEGRYGPYVTEVLSEELPTPSSAKKPGKGVTKKPNRGPVRCLRV